MAEYVQASTRKNAVKSRGRPFERGNPGRPRGSRNKATLAAEAILDGEAEALARKAIELALNGDLQALRICLDRLLPPRRERLVRFSLPPISAGADASQATTALISAVAHGELAPGEVASLVQIVEAHTQVLLVSEFEQRLTKLEAEDK